MSWREWPIVQWWYHQRWRRQYERACLREAPRHWQEGRL